jgi:hypothetical protein
MRKTPLTRDNTLSSFLFDDTFLCLVLTSVRRQLLFYVLEHIEKFYAQSITYLDGIKGRALESTYLEALESSSVGSNWSDKTRTN